MSLKVSVNILMVHVDDGIVGLREEKIFVLGKHWLVLCESCTQSECIYIEKF